LIYSKFLGENEKEVYVNVVLLYVTKCFEAWIIQSSFYVDFLNIHLFLNKTRSHMLIILHWFPNLHFYHFINFPIILHFFFSLHFNSTPLIPSSLFDFLDNFRKSDSSSWFFPFLNLLFQFTWFELFPFLFHPLKIFYLEK